MADGIERFLCIASYEKGHDFLRQCAEMGVKPTLLTLDKLRDSPGPMTCWKIWSPCPLA